MTTFQKVFFFMALTFFSLEALEVEAADIPLDMRMKSASDTAHKNPSCLAITNFYLEIGDANEVLLRDTLGLLYTRNSVFSLASASKLAFATYAMERIKSPNLDQLQKMQMSSGYGRYNPTLCPAMNTVASCFNAGKNAKLLNGEIGLFHYGDGHDNKLAIDLGMGDMGARKLTEEIQQVLGEDTTFSYAFPDVVGGMQATPAGYGNFMRKLLSGKFVMSNYIGSYPVCTQPKSCSTSVRSPLSRAMHYSLNHWVEDDPKGDGAFSSIGLYGFYPWISADKQYYGILAMNGLPRVGVPLGMKCGGAIRKAWMTGSAVTK